MIGRAAPDGLIVPVRLTPKASRDAIEGLREDASGGRVLAVKVTAVPEKGKANAALEKLLAQDARRLGAAGYTVTDVRGSGRGGTREGSWEADRSIDLKRRSSTARRSRPICGPGWRRRSRR